MLNRLTGGGGSFGVEEFEGKGDTEGDGKCESTSGRVFRAIGGGGPPGAGCDLPGLDGEWVDRRGGGGGGGSFDLCSCESRFLEELLYAQVSVVRPFVQPREPRDRRFGWGAHLESIPGATELVRRRILRLESLRFDVCE